MKMDSATSCCDRRGISARDMCIFIIRYVLESFKCSSVVGGGGAASFLEAEGGGAGFLLLPPAGFGGFHNSSNALCITLRLKTQSYSVL